MSEYNMGPFKPNEKGEFNPETRYKYFDMVSYNGSSFLNINRDPVDGDSCIGIIPEGDERSEEYWFCIAHKGDTGRIEQYKPFITITNGIWDFSLSDKCIVPTEIGELRVDNTYDGCCGIMITDHPALKILNNSDYSIDFDYVKALSGQYYMYSFVCMNEKLIWNRTVIRHG